MIKGKQIDLIVADDLADIELRINQSRVKKVRMEDSNAPFSARWKDAEKRGYKVYRGKHRWRLEYTTQVGQSPTGRRSALLRELPITTILKQAKLDKHMTMGAIKRAAFEYAIAHEVLLRVKNGPQRPKIDADALRELAKGNFGAWLSKRLDQALFTHLIEGHPISLRSFEDGTPEVKTIPVHDFYHRGEDASVDGAAPSGEITD